MSNMNYIKGFGISYAGSLDKIKKNPDQLQPLYEAFTNSLEAIRQLNVDSENGWITITLSFMPNLLSTETGSLDLQSISIEDSGIGFNDEEYERFINLNDNRKGYFNKGSGRVQYLHYFEKTEFVSTFKSDNSTSKFKQRKFTLSKSNAFLRHNAIIRDDGIQDVEATTSGTKLTFTTPLSETDLKFYNSLTLTELREAIINRYLAFFCENRNTIPKIRLQKLISSTIKEEYEIQSQDIPQYDKEQEIEINYSRGSFDGKTIEKTQRVEKLSLKGFKISKDKLKKNGLKLTSKGEIAKDLKLDSLLADDNIDGNRYLFLLSGEYINNRDTDTRGNLTIPTLEEFKKRIGNSQSPEMFQEEEILLDDIRDKANETIVKMYGEIVQRTDEKKKTLAELQAMFLLDYESITDAKIKTSDSEEEILEKVYKADAKLAAKRDSEIKKSVDRINTLNPNSKEFDADFKVEVERLTKVIPLQNRTALTHYVARRKLVLDLFDKILKRQLDVQNNGDKVLLEALIHNILFQKSSDKPQNSDLWLINEDFIYFSGTSDKQLNKVTIEDELLFKEVFSSEEEKYLTSLGENRKIKRPDVLLFPDEGKCIIIEFKAPEVNVSEHLSQIDFYANLIRNYTEDKFQITTFYGYLIGESIEPRDVLGRVSSYEHSYQFDYLYRPSQKVIGFDGRSDGSIYSEVIKYSTLLERAKRRNSIFIDKL